MEQLVVTILFSFISGGLAGAVYNHWRSSKDAKLKAEVKEKATIAALLGEVRFAKRICEINANAKGQDLHTFIHLPTIVVSRVAFEERDGYPRLEKLQKELEQYALSATEINELINVRYLTFQINNIAPHVIARFVERIVNISDGTEALREIDSGVSFYFPIFINKLLVQLTQLVPMQT